MLLIIGITFMVTGLVARLYAGFGFVGNYLMITLVILGGFLIGKARKVL